MRTPAEIKVDLDHVNVELCEREAEIAAEREKIREAAKKAISEIGKAKRAAAKRYAALEREYGAAMLAWKS